MLCNSYDEKGRNLWNICNAKVPYMTRYIINLFRKVLICLRIVGNRKIHHKAVASCPLGSLIYEICVVKGVGDICGGVISVFVEKDAVCQKLIFGICRKFSVGFFKKRVICL